MRWTWAISTRRTTSAISGSWWGERLPLMRVDRRQAVGLT
jgi:hypothetical protein